MGRARRGREGPWGGPGGAGRGLGAGAASPAPRGARGAEGSLPCACAGAPRAVGRPAPSWALCEPGAERRLEAAAGGGGGGWRRRRALAARTAWGALPRRPPAARKAGLGGSPWTASTTARSSQVAAGGSPRGSRAVWGAGPCGQAAGCGGHRPAPLSRGRFGARGPSASLCVRASGGGILQLFCQGCAGPAWASPHVPWGLSAADSAGA